MTRYLACLFSLLVLGSSNAFAFSNVFTRLLDFANQDTEVQETEAQNIEQQEIKDPPAHNLENQDSTPVQAQSSSGEKPQLKGQWILTPIDKAFFECSAEEECPVPSGVAENRGFEKASSAPPISINPNCCEKNNPLCQQGSSCNEFAKSFMSPSDQDTSGLSEFTEIGSMFMFTNYDHIMERRGRDPALCNECYGHALNVMSPQNSLDSFEQGRKTARTQFFLALKKRQIQKRFRAFRRYKEQLHQFHGIYGNIFKAKIERQGRDKYLCESPQAIFENLENPSPDSKCGRYRAEIGEDLYGRVLSGTLDIVAQEAEIGSEGDLKQNMIDYWSNFDVAENLSSEKRCLTRAGHSVFLAAQFHDSHEKLKARASLVYEVMDLAFPANAQSEKEQLKLDVKEGYCDKKQNVVPYEFMISRVTGEDSAVFQKAQNDSAFQQRMKSIGLDTDNLDKSLRDLLITSGLIEPTIGLMFSSKQAFCDHYIGELIGKKNTNTENLIKHKDRLDSASKMAEILASAASQCETFQDGLVDSICTREDNLDEMSDLDIQHALDSMRDQVQPSDPLAGMIENSLICEIKPESSETLQRNSLFDYSSSIADQIDHFVALSSQGESDKSNTSRAGAIHFNHLNNLLRKDKADAQGNMCSGWKKELAEFQGILKSSLGLEFADEDMARFGASAQIESQDVKSLLDQGAQAAAKRAADIAANGNNSSSGLPATGSSTMTSGATVGMDMSPDEMAQQVADRSAAGNNIAPELEDDMDADLAGPSSYEKLLEQQQRARDLYQQSQNRFQGAVSNIISDGDLNTADVADAVSSGSIRDRFGRIRDQIQAQTGKSQNEANQDLINAITGSDGGQLASSLAGKNDSDLLAQIEALKNEIKEIKRKSDAKEIDDSSKSYISQLEDRIKQLESESPQQAKTRSISSTRSTANKGRSGQTVGNDFSEGLRSIGGVTGGSPAYTSQPFVGASYNPVSSVGNYAVMKNIMENPEKFIQSNDFNLAYAGNKLYLKVAQKDINEPINLSNVFVDGEGRVTTFALPNNKVVQVSSLNDSSRQALEQYVAANLDSIEKAKAQELEDLKKELKRTEKIRELASEVESQENSESAYQELIQFTNSL